MTSVKFNNSLLQQPEQNDYLWRFFKNFKKLKEFLDGNIFLAPLRSYDDFLESILPENYYILQFINNLAVLNHDGFEQKIFPNFKNLQEKMQLDWIQNNLKKIWKIDNKEELSKKIKESISQLTASLDKHNELQERTYSSCWLINNSYDEDYLMWKSYSAPGGFALRIRYKTFIDILDKALLLEENKHFHDPTITKSFASGKIIYHHFWHGDEWIKDVSKNIPLSYFKHSSYKHEKEFRICVEFLKPNTNLNKIFFYNFWLWNFCDIILHPSTFFVDYEMHTNTFKENNIQLPIKFSSFSSRKLVNES